MDRVLDTLLSGWVWALAYPVLLVLVVAIFGAAAERHLIAPDPEEIEPAVTPWKAGELVQRPHHREDIA